MTKQVTRKQFNRHVGELWERLSADDDPDDDPDDDTDDDDTDDDDEPDTARGRRRATPPPRKRGGGAGRGRPSSKRTATGVSKLWFGDRA